MFLFTTTPDPAPTRSVSETPVVAAIRTGAQATGADFDYLLRTAKRESSLDPSAKAGSSSATGLFQFIEQTWLGLVKSDGDRLGLGAQSKAVTMRSDGSFTVPDPGARQAILKLREDPQVASVMAGALTQQNREALTASLGRPPSAGELYIAHVLGARGAADLIGKAKASPATPAAALMPEAARANRSIFFDASGRARGAAEVYGVLAGMQSGVASPSASGTTVTGQSAAATTVTGFSAPGLEGLFQTGPRPGPISEAVAKLWRGQDRQTAPNAASFFPRQGDGGAPPIQLPAPPQDLPAATDGVPAPGANVPLPPPRPASLSAVPPGARVSAAAISNGSLPYGAMRPGSVP